MRTDSKIHQPASLSLTKEGVVNSTSRIECLDILEYPFICRKLLRHIILPCTVWYDVSMLSNWRVGSCPCGVVTPRGILPSTTDCGSKAEWTSDIDWYNRIQPDWCLIAVVLNADLVVISYFDRLSLWHIQRPFQKGVSPVYAEQALTALWTQVPSYCIYVLYLFSDSYITTYIHTSPAIHDVSAPPSNGRIGYYGLIRLTPFSFVSTIIAFFFTSFTKTNCLICDDHDALSCLSPYAICMALQSSTKFHHFGISDTITVISPTGGNTRLLAMRPTPPPKGCNTWTWAPFGGQRSAMSLRANVPLRSRF